MNNCHASDGCSISAISSSMLTTNEILAAPLKIAASKHLDFLLLLPAQLTIPIIKTIPTITTSTITTSSIAHILRLLLLKKQKMRL